MFNVNINFMGMNRDKNVSLSENIKIINKRV